jgi:hypothetical protein
MNAQPQTPESLLAEFDRLESNREAQTAWLNGLSGEVMDALAQAIGARSFARKQEQERLERMKHWKP